MKWFQLDHRPSDRYPVPEAYAERLLRAAGCRGAQLLGWREGLGPRCRMCGTVAVLETAMAWEDLRDWGTRDESYAERSYMVSMMRYSPFRDWDMLGAVLLGARGGDLHAHDHRRQRRWLLRGAQRRGSVDSR